MKAQTTHPIPPAITLNLSAKAETTTDTATSEIIFIESINLVSSLIKRT